MKTFLFCISEYFESVPNRIRPWRCWIITLALTCSLFMAVGSTRFVIDVTVDSWFSEDDPVLQSLDEFRDQWSQ